MDSRRILTVTDINETIKASIDNNVLLQSLFIRGEISNFTQNKSGHLYFTLKDETSKLNTVMFVRDAKNLKFSPTNGMKVIAAGRISTYVQGGSYQLYASMLEPDGVGALHVAYEQLKAKLQKEGLFDEAKKKAIPRIPKRIGVVTSPTGAVIRDIINVTGRRYPMACITLFPAIVQGEGAAAQLIAGVKFFNCEPFLVDVIIIGRGGGSIEDLWAFNSEELARAIAASNVPVISAVGHESDFTICDFVADRRAPTPSAAAEIAVPDRTELISKIENVTTHMARSLNNLVALQRTKLFTFAGYRVLCRPMAYIDDRRLSLINASDKLDGSVGNVLKERRAKLANSVVSLEALNPLKVLTRGYSAAFSQSGDVIDKAQKLNVGDNFKLSFTDGEILAQVIEKKNII